MSTHGAVIVAVRLPTMFMQLLQPCAVMNKKADQDSFARRLASAELPPAGIDARTASVQRISALSWHMMPCGPSGQREDGSDSGHCSTLPTCIHSLVPLEEIVNLDEWMQ